jgi:hypothetical protein
MSSLVFAPLAHAEALSTTSMGIGIRNVTYTENKPSTGADSESTGTAQTNQETFNDPMICQRVSTPSSLGLELGAGGCVHGGGFWTFSHTISAHLQLIYYPFASRTRIDDDGSIRMRRQFFGDFYIIGQGGFAKITHGQSQSTPRTFSMDLVEFGGGAGWSYRMFNNVAFGVEGFYLFGALLSKATSGSTSIMTGMASLTVFL